ncbi:MAG: thiamine pyrophosphate-binding protein [Promethearchaeota archaeon]|nr:MAG: thiamine pyrophosphate-binding protein [Candidatus Lokiarchaeota archaeon]
MARVIDMVVDAIIQAGIDHAFCLPGGYTQFLIDGLYQHRDKMNVIVSRHEGAASAMADMYGRITKKPGLLAGQGLWIGTNGAFGIVEAYLAGSPMLIITDVSDWDNMSLYGTYQCGSGEYGAVDLPNIFRSMTKFTTYATTPLEVVYGVQLAIKHAISGRPGPAAVVTRMSSIGGVIDDPASLNPPIYPTQGYLRVNPPSIARSDAEKMADYLIGSENPVLICGRGIHASSAYEEVQEIAELIGMPVATSYMGKSSIAETHDLALGVMASRGQKLATDLIAKADTILAVGTCLAPDNTNSCSKEFINVENQKLLHIDIDPRNAGWTYPVTLGATSDAKLGLRAVINAIKVKNPQIDVQKRISELKALKEKPENEFFTNKWYDSTKVPIEPERIVKELNELVGEDDLVVLDAGNNRIWFCKMFKSKKAGQVIGPGGAAGMAWGPSASVAAQLLHTKGKVISTVGDGGMMMALYNIETVKQYNLPLMYVVLNNQSLGNVRDFFSRKSRALAEYPETNFAKVANSMGVEGIRVEEEEDLRPALEKGLKSDKPTVIDVVTNRASHLRVRTSL